MNDLTMLDDLGAALDPATDAPPAALRHRALAPTRDAVQARARSFRPRLGWRLAASGGLAAAVVAGVLVAQLDAGVQRGTDAPATAVFAAPTDPSAVLHNAALVAFRSPVPRPRPNQLVFVESVNRYGSVSGDGVRTPGVPTVRQVWLSVAGAYPGMVRSRPKAGGTWEEIAIPGCRNGRTPIDASKDSPCQLIPAYRDDLPTAAGAMRRVLYSGNYGSPAAAKPSRDQRAFTMVGDLIRESYLPPAALAALFEAAATIPGTVVERDIVDAAGRRGIAVTRTDAGSRDELIFDAKTYEFLGERGVAVADFSPAGIRKGEQVYNSRLRIAIVDKVGQLP